MQRRPEVAGDQGGIAHLHGGAAMLAFLSRTRERDERNGRGKQGEGKEQRRNGDGVGSSDRQGKQTAVASEAGDSTDGRGRSLADGIRQERSRAVEARLI